MTPLVDSDTIKEFQVILHVGLPKTGSTALQKLLFANRNRLEESGVLYDRNVLSENNPKHQWLALGLRDPGNLASQDFGRFQGFQRILLSTESITNEFPIFRNDDIAAVSSTLRTLGRLCLVMVVRSPLDWAKSYYKQAVINGRSSRMAFYGTDKPFAEFVALPHVSALLDQEELAGGLEEKFGVPVFVTEHERTMVRALADRLAGCELDGDGRDELNASLPDVAVEVLRQLNGMVQAAGEKNAWSRVFVEVGYTGSSALNALAARASDEAVRALSEEKLHRLEFLPNLPLRIDRQEFEKQLASLRQGLLSLKDRLA